MRLFSALEIPVEIREDLLDWWVSAKSFFYPSMWKDVPPRNWHITLAFYGEVDGRNVDDLTDALSACAGRQLPLQLALRGFGPFPSFGRPRVFWAGVDDEESGGRELVRLARCCRRSGHATVRKRSAKEGSFRGHITLARAAKMDMSIKMNVLQALPVPPPLTWVADRMHLVQSTLQPDGARYRILEEFTLGD